MENYYNGSSSSYTYATSPYNAYNGYSHYPYQYSYPYLYQSPWELHQQVINTTGSNLSHLEPTVQYSTGRLTCTFPDRMTITIEEDGEIIDDYSQFYDEDKIKKELASREETILKHLKRRIHVNSKDHPKSQEPEICVICQAEYEDNERIGTTQCGHEYHVDCIKKWLLENTFCPICKTTALATKN
ncbi:hypothetical protein LguiB_002271 [Lonicera macranthoides]